MWRDSWIPRPYSYKPITAQGTCRICFVSDLLNDNGSWNQALLQEYFMPADVTEILKIRASPRLEEDTLAWGPGKYGIFFVKSAYQLGFDGAYRSTATGSSSRPDDRRSCWQMIWGSEVPPTVRNFSWRVTTDSLPMWRNKHARNLETTDLCPVGVHIREKYQTDPGAAAESRSEST